LKDKSDANSPLQEQTVPSIVVEGMITTSVSVLISRLEDADVILPEHTFADSIESKAPIE
jgi:hypothetical protein